MSSTETSIGPPHQLLGDNLADSQVLRTHNLGTINVKPANRIREKLLRAVVLNFSELVSVSRRNLVARDNVDISWHDIAGDQIEAKNPTDQTIANRLARSELRGINKARVLEQKAVKIRRDNHVATIKRSIGLV